MTRSLRLLLCTSLLLLAISCAQDDDVFQTDQAEPTISVDTPVDEFGKTMFLPTGAPEEVSDKSDTLSGLSGLPTSVDQGDTSVWEVTNQWEDTATVAAKKAGLAWGANSGLTWEQKFTRWVDSLERQSSTTRPGAQTYTLTTPWGKSLPSPSLECAESAIFLRVAFASWYNLPFYLEAADAKGRVYFGHFGMRRTQGKYERTPDFKTRYADFSSQADAIRAGAPWPVDRALVEKKIPGTSEDSQPMIGPDAHTGAYFDQVFLNKRAAHFLVTTLAFFGSIHLADARNMFNVVPSKLQTGDVLVHRWQRQGIGHVLLVMNVDTVGQVDGQPRYEAELASGSMPRRQPVWEGANTSQRNFTSDYAGGPEKADLGGGLKRWRIAKKIGSRWANVVSNASAPDWVNSSDLQTIGARPALFASVLQQLTPTQKRDTLLQVIEQERSHLRRFPASCAARIRREKAFGDLYTLMSQDFGRSAPQVDQAFRTLEDYVFAELSYEDSKTCCWNSSTAQMHEIVMDYNHARQSQAQACLPPVPFINRADQGDGYAIFRAHAKSLGREAQWKPWSADESCPQAAVPEDTLVTSALIPFCDLSNPPADTTTTVGTFSGPTQIPDNSPRGIRLQTEVTTEGAITALELNLAITHTYRGDLEVELVAPNGTTVKLKTRSSDSAPDLQERYTPTRFLGQDALGTWTLIIRDLAAQDLGTLQSATLSISR